MQNEIQCVYHWELDLPKIQKRSMFPASPTYKLKVLALWILCYSLKATSAGKLILFPSHIFRPLFACLLLCSQHIKANIWNKALGASHICCWTNKANVTKIINHASRYKTTCLLWLEERNTQPLIVAPRLDRYLARNTTVFQGLIKAKGWEQLGDKISR